MHLLLLIFKIVLVYSSTSCSIFPSLNCSCFQSNLDLTLNLNSSRKVYSHLYCQGNLLNDKTFQSPYGSDFKYQNHFRTVSLEFSTENSIEIQSNQFDPLAMLFSETDVNAQIDIYLRFNGFKHMTFHESSLTSTIFQRKHRNRHLWLHLIPMRINLTDIDVDNENFTNLNNQFHFSSNCFSGLILSELRMYLYTIRDDLPLLYSFEQIFNNTNIGEVHLYGSLIPPSPSSSLLRQTFRGFIRSLKLHRHVDMIDSNTFPFYSQVYSYTIHSTDAHSMNLSSFASHTNLRGLEIIKPRFEILIDQFLPTLDSLTLDIEELNEYTLLFARHIHNLKLGSQLRRINGQILNILSRRLNHFDLSDVDLSQMTSDSRCYLIQYLSNISQTHLNIIYPRSKELNQCDCTRLFLKQIQFNIQNDSTCAKLCQLNDCQIISEYFKEKSSSFIHKNQSTYLLNQTNDQKENTDEQLSAVEIYSDPVDIDIISFLINQTTEQDKNQIQKRPVTIPMENISVLENIEVYDDISYSTTTKLFETSTIEIDGFIKESFSWLAFFIGVGVILVLLLIISLIICLIIHYRKEHHFKPVPVYV